MIERCAIANAFEHAIVLLCILLGVQEPDSKKPRKLAGMVCMGHCDEDVPLDLLHFYKHRGTSEMCV